MPAWTRHVPAFLQPMRTRMYAAVNRLATMKAGWIATTNHLIATWLLIKKDKKQTRSPREGRTTDTEGSIIGSKKNCRSRSS